MSIELKIKAKSLAAEATIIRKEERKALTSARWLKEHQQDSGVAYAQHWNLQHHRRGVVRNAARQTHVARAFIKGATYASCETPTRNPLSGFQIDAIAKTVSKYHKPVSRKDVELWVSPE